MTVAAVSVRYQFAGYELHPEERRLLAGGLAVPLGPHAFDLLVVLVERGGRLVTKDELLAQVWPKVVVEENTLQVHISSLRKALGANAIATVSGRGYRFNLDVAEVSAARPLAPDAHQAQPSPPADELHRPRGGPRRASTVVRPHAAAHADRLRRVRQDAPGDPAREASAPCSSRRRVARGTRGADGSEPVAADRSRRPRAQGASGRRA